MLNATFGNRQSHRGSCFLKMPGLQCLLMACVAMGMMGWAVGARAATPVGFATIVDCESILLRGTEVFKLVEGVRLYPEDIIESSGANSCFVQIEFDDGASLGLGSSTRLMLTPRIAVSRAKPVPRAYVLQGLIKLRSTPASTLATPWVDLAVVSSSAVLIVQPETAAVFAESGQLTGQTWRAGAVSSVQLKSGELMTWSLNAKPVTHNRPDENFLRALPRPFLDTLPARASIFRDAGREVRAKRVGEVNYAQIQPWIDSEPALRRANMARWKILVRNQEIRRALLATLSRHPEWEIVLRPPPAPSSDARPRTSAPTLQIEKGVTP